LKDKLILFLLPDICPRISKTHLISDILSKVK